jgi:hypothetical protein
MANRRYDQFRYSLEHKVVDLFAKVTFGASGAPTLAAAVSKGIKSIVRNGAGDYTVTLQDPYAGLLLVKHNFDTSGAAGAAPAAPGMWLKAQSVGTSSGGTIRLVFNAAGTATDPASGEAVLLQLVLKNSSV